MENKMFCKVLTLAVVLALSQARRNLGGFRMFEVDEVKATGLGIQCKTGLATTVGCVLEEPNGKFLVISELNTDRLFVKVDKVHPTGIGTCPFGIPSVEGCVMQDKKDGRYVVLQNVDAYIPPIKHID